MTFVHPSADVSPAAHLGNGVRVWQQAQVREGSRIGDHCNVGKGVYVGVDVQVGANCKVHNYALLHEGVTLEDGVFVGPQVCFANDQYPRAINPDGTLKTDSDWELVPTHVGYGAAIGARSVILPGVKIGRFALIGAGSVVTKDVPAHGLVRGNPAQLVGYVCECGRPAAAASGSSTSIIQYACSRCRANQETTSP